MSDSLTLRSVTRETAAAAGYAVFNNGPHVCVDVPDGHSTITCRTSAGELVTFAFVPYAANSPPACVDVHHKTAQRTYAQAGDELPAMNVICFSGGRDAYRSVEFPGHPPAVPTTLVGILLH